MPKRNSSVVGREFGNGVRDAIEQSGMTQRKLAELLGWQEAKVSDLVQGKGGVDEVDLVRLLSYCRVPAADVEHMLALFKESREKGWLLFPEDGVPEQLRSLVEQERLASKIFVWTMNLIPGLLQIAGYIREVAERSTRDLGPADVDALIRAKLERQAILRPGREFVFYVHEQALRLPVGGPVLMRTQLNHIMVMLVRRYITFRVVPIAIGAHAGLAGNFTLLAYEKFEPVVYLENLNTGLFLEDKTSLDMYTDLLKGLDRDALDPEQSRELITGIVF
ncbi:Helix-turn-helix domain-containing protein [Lentzea xinjiangensis]|uniref:Helix-turn-helix domain-containing protein n=1 Tax=Lentzea xinjiangensis TaxID=402600 RepID=A0A1H9E0T8_9PSEU|nr:helix-turn-helix transcriptional regulator [Lentzea xinjiangensis]SEQ18558.1 Helix-turn-helix domain-containing protein [Lentzea xinjiangensis]